MAPVIEKHQIVVGKQVGKGRHFFALIGEAGTNDNQCIASSIEVGRFDFHIILCAEFHQGTNVILIVLLLCLVRAYRLRLENELDVKQRRVVHRGVLGSG